MSYKIIKKQYTVPTLLAFAVSLSAAFEIERTDKVSQERSVRSTFELWNKGDHPILAIVSYGGTKKKERIHKFNLRPQEKIRFYTLFSHPIYVYIWDNIAMLKRYDIRPDLEKKITARGKTVYVSYKKGRKGYELQPQKGVKGFTQSGLSLENNIVNSDITNITDPKYFSSPEKVKDY